MEKRETKIHIEFLRIVAIFFVVFNHTWGFSLYALQELGSAQFWIYSFIAVCSKVSVPLFLMISGALLLSKDIAIITVWKTKIIKILVVLSITSIFYYIHNHIMYNTPFEVVDFLQKMYTGQINGHLWYLYLFLGWLISSPLLRKMVENMETKHFVYMIILYLMFISILPTIEYLAWDNMYKINGNISVMWLAANMVGYPCIGYFIENKLEDNIKAKYLVIVWLINVLSIILTCYLTYRYISVNRSNNAQIFLNTFVLINAVTVYITAKKVFGKIKCHRIIKKMICIGGGCTFGIYLFHIAVKDRPFMIKLLNMMIDNDWNYMISYLVYTFVTVIITGSVVWVLKRIPGLKQLL